MCGEHCSVKDKCGYHKASEENNSVKRRDDQKEGNRDEKEMEGVDESAATKDRSVVEVHMPVVYERLPNFCLCCGIIGHQYRECIKYKNKPEDKLEYGPHLKAITTVEKMKQDRERNQ